jgi:hypothetical protein
MGKVVLCGIVLMCSGCMRYGFESFSSEAENQRDFGRDGVSDLVPDGAKDMAPDAARDPDMASDRTVDLRSVLDLVDSAPDSPPAYLPDLSSPDALLSDTMALDSAPDSPLAPDAMAPDVMASDVMAPDVMAPDMMAPDMDAGVDTQCPCSAMFAANYDSVMALLWPVCTTPESANSQFQVHPKSQYIAAHYIDGSQIFTVLIASNSSTSSLTDRRNTCYVRTDGDALVAGPLPVSDAEHAACVEDIRQREVICRGCNWLQTPCPNP